MRIDFTRYGNYDLIQFDPEPGMEPEVVVPEDREYLDRHAYVPAGAFEAWLAEHGIEHTLWDHQPKRKRKKKPWCGTCELGGKMLVLAKFRFWE